jgi:hypothetical protein
MTTIELVELQPGVWFSRWFTQKRVDPRSFETFAEAAACAYREHCQYGAIVRIRVRTSQRVLATVHIEPCVKQRLEEAPVREL